MKKQLLFILSLVLTFGLFACGGGSTSLVISKVFDATAQSDNVIELYNTSDQNIDLNNYSLNFYTNGSIEVSKTIDLTGTIEANSYFAISGNAAVDSTIIAKTDFVYDMDSLPFNGNDVIELTYNGTVIDTVGQKGINIAYAKDLTLIRLGEPSSYTPSAEFYEYDFIYYLPDLFQYLKNDDYEIKTLDDLYAGPRLEDRYLTMPYVNETVTTNGGGGAVETVNAGIADGDTAYFSAEDGFPGGSVRYFYLNTPEVDGSYVSAEPWGYVASKYNKEYLLNDAASKTIHIQSIPGYSLTEVNGRNLALVWVNGYLSQFLIVSEGLSEDVGITYESHDLALSYKNVPYLTFLRFAEERAIQNGWGTKGYPSNPNGEKSPDWNYNGDYNTTNNPVWTPHLALPWE